MVSGPRYVLRRMRKHSCRTAAPLPLPRPHPFGEMDFSDKKVIFSALSGIFSNSLPSQQIQYTIADEANPRKMEAKLCRFNQSCTESIADKLKFCTNIPFLKKGDPFFLWPQNFIKMDTHARYLHYHNELELGWCTEGSGIFFVEDKVIPFQAPVPRSSTRGRSISPRAIPISPQNGILSMSMNAFSAPKMTNPLRRDISAPPYWMTPLPRAAIS